MSNHGFEIKNIEMNVKMQTIMTVSQECCHLWNTNTFAKLKSIYAKDGCLINSARFTVDGQSVATLLNTGDLLLWSLDTTMQLDSSTIALTFKSNLMTCFDVGL
jgi:hypothetical protein